MKKLLRWVLLLVGLVVVAVLLLGQHYVLSSTKLDADIKKEIPIGSAKVQVIQFVRTRHPVAFDDMGAEVKARFSGLAENMLYRKDVVLTFEFGPEGKLASYTKKEYLSFF